MAVMAALTLKDFSHLIYEQLIVNIIPVEEEEEEEEADSDKRFDYSMEAEICTRITRFEQKLAAHEYTISAQAVAGATGSSSEGAMKSFSNNVEELYVRKKCKHVMERAREMMRNRDMLFDLVETNALLRDLKESGDELVKRLKEIEKKNKGKCSALDELDLLALPLCSISKLAKQVL